MPRRETLPTKAGRLDSRVRERNDWALVAAVCFVLTAAALTRRDRSDDPTFSSGSWTIYPWWTWVLVGVGLCAALTALVRPHRPAVLVGAPAVAAVMAAQIAGTGVVGSKHWRPAIGMGGYGDHLRELQVMAGVMAACGLTALVVCTLRLRVVRRASGVSGRGSRASCALVGGGVVVLLPVGVALVDHDARDLTSTGAVLLVYGLPWGASLVAAGWLPRPAGLATTATVALSAGCATVGPQMWSLVADSARPVFAGALAASVLVGMVVHRASSSVDTPSARPEGTWRPG